MHLVSLKTKLILLLIVSSAFLKAQNEKFIESYIQYQNDVSEGKY